MKFLFRNLLLWQRRIAVWSLGIGAIYLSSCAPMYIPNKVNIPLLSHAGELQVGAFGATSGLDPQVTYAITNHVAVMANGSFRNDEPDSTTTNYHKHSFGELGVGYYKQLSDNLRFEVFAGYGGGNIEALYSNSLFSDYAKTKIKRFFIQPDVGFTTKVVDPGLAMRFVIVNATQANQNITRAFLEPAVSLKAGFEYIKFVFQAGLSIPFQNDNMIEQEPFIAAVGIQAYLFKGYTP